MCSKAIYNMYNSCPKKYHIDMSPGRTYFLFMWPMISFQGATAIQNLLKRQIGDFFRNNLKFHDTLPFKKNCNHLSKLSGFRA